MVAIALALTFAGVALAAPQAISNIPVASALPVSFYSFPAPSATLFGGAPSASASASGTAKVYFVPIEVLADLADEDDPAISFATAGASGSGSASASGAQSTVFTAATSFSGISQTIALTLAPSSYIAVSGAAASQSGVGTGVEMDTQTCSWSSGVDTNVFTPTATASGSASASAATPTPVTFTGYFAQCNDVDSVSIAASAQGTIQSVTSQTLYDLAVPATLSSGLFYYYSPAAPTITSTAAAAASGSGSASASASA